MKPELIPVLDRQTIAQLVCDLGAKISEDYRGRPLVLIGVLKGAFIFLSDLVRSLQIPVEIDFIQVASYGSGTASSGEIRLCKPVDVDVRNKDVLLVEDIVDTGLTLQFLLDYLSAMEPASLNVCAMIDKRERRRTGVSIAYAAHRTQEGFLVGYGLDYDQKYRELPEIYHLQF